MQETLKTQHNNIFTNLKTKLNKMEATEENYGGFFDEDKESLKTVENNKGETNPDLYRISLDLETVKNRTYTSRGRFLKDPSWPETNSQGKTSYKAKVFKKMYYMIDPTNPQNKFYVECPSNWNVPISQNIVSSAFFRLREMESVTLKRIANANFGQLRYWWSLFQILIDEQQPALQGKIKIFRYGKPVDDTIQAAVDGQPNLGKPGIDVFNAFTGKDFLITVFEKSVEDKEKGGGAVKKFPSYEKSSFDDTITSILIDGERVPNTTAGKMKVLEYIKSEAPDLRQMDIVKWDDATEQKVIESMRIAIGDDKLLNQIINDCRKGVRRSKVVVSTETQDKIDKEATLESTASSKTNNPSWDEGAKETTENHTEEATFSSDSDGLPAIETEFEQMN